MTRSNIQLGGQELKLDADADTSITADTDDQIDFKTGGSDRLTIDSSGNVGIGSNNIKTWSLGKALHIGNSENCLWGEADYSLHIVQNAYYNSAWKYTHTDEASLYTIGDGTHIWSTASSGTADASLTWSEAMRIHSNGTVSIGTTSVNPVSSNVQGFSFRGQYGECQISSEGSTGAPLYLNRMSSDGDILVFRQDGTTEGQVSVSGSTVSYNGFSGLHESSGIATNTAIGTVVSTVDELDTYADGNKSGQTRANHAKVEVSDTVGDSAVYGVVASFNAHDKVNVASVGIGSVRVTGACAKGDLLESNGDGTAKVQSDDIVRSKTIGKVTIGNSNSGVKLVSCVLYCG